MKQRFWVLVAGLLCFAVTSRAQAPTAVVNGQVRDTSGAAIPSATVVVINDATNVRYTSETNSEGIYSVPNLPPGTYHIQVSKQGFKTIVHPDVVLHVQDAEAIGFTLPVGPTSDTVTVEGGAPLINTENAAVSTVIDRNFVENLPLNGRSFNTVLQLTPGVSIIASNSQVPGQFSSNGQRSSSNYFQVDGVSANFGVSPNFNLYQAGGGGAQAFNAYGGTSSLVSVDAMQEFRVLTSSFAPEFGRSPGAQVLISTRSGTNELHGALFDYFRNTVLDANDWFANRAGQPRAPEQQNDFGGVLGGPLWRKRTFFFISYEGLRLLQPTTTIVTVPSNSVRTSAVPAAAPVLNTFPVPNGAVLNASTAQFIGNYSAKVNMDAGSLRIDHSFGHGLNVFGRLNWSPSQIVTRAEALSELQTIPTNTRTATIGLNEEISPRFYNSVRMNFSKQTADQTSVLDSFGGAVPISTELLLPSPYSASKDFAALNPLDTSVLSVGRLTNNSESQFNILDDVNLATGRHQWKFGMDYRRLNLDLDGIPIEPSYIYFTGSFASSGNTLGARFLGSRSGSVALPNISTYFQDTWTVGQRVTLTYGLRWEINPAPSAGDGMVLASWQDLDNPAATTLAPLGTPIYNTTYGSFAPRIGLAYRLNKAGDFVVRAGWGIFYDLQSSIAPELAVSYPNLANKIFFSVPIPDPNFAAHAQSLTFSTQPPFGGGSSVIIAFDPNLELPLTYQWNVSVEKAIAGKQSLSVTYVGAAGRRLIRQEAIPSPNSNLPAGYTLINNDASSDYNALQLQYKRLLYRRVQALASYTWSHSIDTASDDFNGALSPVISPVSANRGNSGFDVRHNFTGTLTYELPSVSKEAFLHAVTDGWSLATVFQVRSGFPIDISLNRGGTTLSRPDFDSTKPVWIPDPTSGPGKKLNPAAFPVPSTRRQGTLPRNSIYGLGAGQLDVSIQRRFALTERVHLDFRTDAFNILNHPNFANPKGNVTDGQFGLFYQMLNKGLAGLSPLYQIGGPRSLQLSLRLSF